MMTRSSSEVIAPRHGSTLLEVLLATAILSMSLAAIGQLAKTGVNAGLRVQQQSQAALHCQSQLELLLAGTLPLRNVNQAAMPHAPEWLYSISIAPAQDGLLQVLVEVTHESGQRSAHAQAVQLIHPESIREELR